MNYTIADYKLQADAPGLVQRPFLPSGVLWYNVASEMMKTGQTVDAGGNRDRVVVAGRCV